ncbi:MAG: glycosyltransferase family 2 protein [Cyanobacteriota bacterium]|nr:glycosyltransferase family 2 protein [Cyanobacteriota bacterium]
MVLPIPTDAAVGAIALIALSLGLPSFAILLSRLLKGAKRKDAIAPRQPTPEMLGTVRIVVPTLNEVQRIDPCLIGLTQQSYEVREILVVDSYSEDGTREKVKAAGEKDPRFRLLTDEPLPSDWVGRPWALHYGFLSGKAEGRWGDGEMGSRGSRGAGEQGEQGAKWFLGIDADTQPQAGLVAGLLAVAEAESYDLISLSPQFILSYPGEWWLQPALLMTLLYRFDSSGVDASTPDRVMANGQCFLCRRAVLEAVEGYESAKRSFCDDVTLARHIAAQGYKVGFLDGSRVLRVRMYEGLQETWREWGRSLDLKDASSEAQLWGDLGFLLLVQALPIPLSLAGCCLLVLGYHSISLIAATGFNVFLVLIRFALLFAIAPSYARSSSPASWLFWLSPFADPLAVLRIFLSTVRKPKQWRGRTY